MAIRTAAIISTGTEILQGLYADTNARWLAEQLSAEGVEVRLIAASPDDPQELESLLRYAGSRMDLIVCSGGLGPTADDVNREVFSRVFQARLHEDALAVAMMRERFARRGRGMPDNNLVQALLPAEAIPLYNDWGTAPGFFLPPSSERGITTGEVPPCALVALPGPPRELMPMFRERVLPLLRERIVGRQFVGVRVLHTFGAPESELGQYVKDLFVTSPTVAYTMLAKPYGVDVRILVRAERAEDVHARLSDLEAQTRRRIPAYLIYGKDDETLAGVVAELLTQRGATLALAESCTGGLISKLFTDIPGSSAFLLEGAVTYSNAAKIRRVGVCPVALERYGAVSESVARQMAQGALRRSGADFALAVTGIAGPSGGTPQKPVGLTFIALAEGAKVDVRRYVFTGDREFNRTFAALTAINWLRLRLLGHEIA